MLNRQRRSPADDAVSGKLAASSATSTSRSTDLEFRPEVYRGDDTVAAVAAPPPGDGDGQHLRSDVAVSIRNAVQLGLSLLGTWAVALAVRIYLPRHLGPLSFGTFQFADGFTTTIFVVASLGIETYVRKEVATRTDHASEFFAGTLLIRLAISLLVMLGAEWALGWGGKPPEVLRLVFVMGVAQVLFNLNGTYAAILQAAGDVAGLSLLNVASKLIWGGGIVVAFAFGGGVLSVAVAMLISEAVRTTALTVLSRRTVGLRFRIDARATWAVMAASLPYYLAALATAVYSRIDVTVMSFLTNDTEVGWYGAASNLAGMSLLLAPLIGWVLLPLTSRAAARSKEELTLVSRRSLELILAAAIPVSLFLYLGAEILVRRVFGPAYAPSTRTLRVLAPLFVLTYAAMVSATVLIRLERGWAVTVISIAGGIASPLLNIWLIPHAAAFYGRGGAGIGAAVALITTEFGTTIAMTALLGGLAFDRRSCIALGKMLGASLAVIVLDHMLAPLGDWRLAVDMLVYAIAVLVTGALDIGEMRALVTSALGRAPRPQLEGA